MPFYASPPALGVLAASGPDDGLRFQRTSSFRSSLATLQEAYGSTDLIRHTLIRNVVMKIVGVKH